MVHAPADAGECAVVLDSHWRAQHDSASSALLA